MTDVAMLIQNAEAMGAVFELRDGNRVKVRAPAPLDDTVMAALRAHKNEVIAYLSQTPTRDGYRMKCPGIQASPEELAEIEARVASEGYVLLWSSVLQDLVAFYRHAATKAKIPPGFVPYSNDELRQLFGEGKPSLSGHTLRLIHETKKGGAHVIHEGEHKVKAKKVIKAPKCTKER